MNAENWIEAARQDTAGCADYIHLNNAGSSLPPRKIVDTVVDHLRLEESVGGYEAASIVESELSRTYSSVARMVGADPSEIAFSDSASRSWLTAFTSLRLSAGDRILTTRSEYSSNIIAMLTAVNRSGVSIEIIPENDFGEVCVESLDRLMDERVRAICATHVPTNGGLVQPLSEIGKISSRSPGCSFIVDACQSIGQIPIDVQESYIDLLSATGRKYLRAPRGTGFLYARNELAENLVPVHADLHSARTDGRSITLRSDAQRFELWERSIANQLGIGAAADYYNMIGPQRAWSRISELAEYLRGMLSECAGVSVRDLGSTKCGIVSFEVAGCDPSEVCATLSKSRVNISFSRMPSTPWDMKRRELTSLCRASVHYYNTTDEICTFVRHLRSLTSERL